MNREDQHRPTAESLLPNRQLLLGALMLLAATFAVYWPALRGDFIWDDDVMVKNNPFVKAPTGLYYIWCTTRLPDFFPLTSTSLWLEWRLWGMNTVGYHVSNVLIHVLSAVLVWRVLRQLAIPAAWVAALLFAIHPVNVESVAWITQRKNTLSMVFFLLSLLYYLRFDGTAQSPRSRTERPPPGPYALYAFSLGAFLLALLAKTSVVMMPFVLLGCVWWRRAKITGRDVLRILPFFALSFVLGLVTVWFQYHRAIGDEIVQTGTFWTRLAIAGLAVWFYLGKVLLPVHLVFVYPRWEISAPSPISYLPLVALVLAAAVLWLYRRSWGRGPLFGLGYFVVMLAPVLGFLNIYFQRYSFVADHWQYYSIIGVIALVAAVWSQAPVGVWAKRAVAGAVAVTLGLLAFRQAHLYVSMEAVWRDTVAKNPGCWMAYNNLGLCLPDNAAGKEQAIAYYQTSLRLQPAQDEAYLNMGAALMGLKRLPDARAAFEAAGRFCPTNSMVYYNLGLVSEEEGKPAAAIDQYRRAIQLWPGYAEAHNNLGALLQLQGQPLAAEAEFRKAVDLDPTLMRARNNLGLALQARGEAVAALAQFHEALRLQPDSPEAHNNLGKALAEQGKPAEALPYFQKALRLKPGYADAQYNIGNTLTFLGQFKEAIPAYLALLQVRPDYTQGRQALAAVYLKAGQTNDAIRQLEEAIRLHAEVPELHYALGDVFLNQGRREEAAERFRTAITLRPGFAEAHYQLGTILSSRKQPAEAIAHLRETVRLNPNWLEALNNLAWLLATQSDDKLRNGPEALRLAAHAVEITRTNHPVPLDTLAAAYAESGQFAAAAASARKAAEIAAQAGQKDLVNEFQQHQQAYEAGRQIRE